MKNLSLSLGRLAIVFVSALTLGACNRAEYPAVSHSVSPSTSTEIAQQSQAAPYIISDESAVVVAPAAPTAAPIVAAAPVAPLQAAPTSRATAPAIAAPEATPAATPTPKLNLAQRLALHKVTKKLDKLANQAPQFKKRDATASTSRLDSNLRTGLLFLIIGLLVSLFTGVAGIFGVIGAILAVIGLVFVVLWLLDQA